MSRVIRRVGSSRVACSAVCSASIRPTATQVQTRKITAATSKPIAAAYIQPSSSPTSTPATTPTTVLTLTRIEAGAAVSTGEVWTSRPRPPTAPRRRRARLDP